MEGTYLDVPFEDLPRELHLASAGIHSCQGHHHLPDDIIPGEAVEAEHQEVQHQVLQLAVGDAVEGEGLVEHRLQGLAQHSGLHAVPLVGQNCHLDVRVRALGVLIHHRQPVSLLDGDHQSLFGEVVVHGESQVSQHDIITRGRGRGGFTPSWSEALIWAEFISIICFDGELVDLGGSIQSLVRAHQPSLSCIQQEVPPAPLPGRAVLVSPDPVDFLLVAQGLRVDADAFQHVNEFVRGGFVLLFCLLVTACPHKDCD